MPETPAASERQDDWQYVPTQDGEYVWIIFDHEIANGDKPELARIFSHDGQLRVGWQFTLAELLSQECVRFARATVSPPPPPSAPGVSGGGELSEKGER